MTPVAARHHALIGVGGGRDRLDTPALILDLDAFEANVAAVAALVARAGVALRPHAKTHKSADIAAAQIAAGAVGQCCAKLGEAEALAAAGIDDILLTSPVVTPSGVARLAALNARCRLAVVSDHPMAVDAIAAAVDRPLRVLIDVDPGAHRTGVASAADAVALARRIAAYPGLVYGGVQFYCGTQQHIVGLADRRAAIADRTAYLRGVIAALADAGFAPPVVTGGGTGSHAIDLDLGVLTELQLGSYIFLDREYGDCELGGAALRTALTVDARVISANTPGMATIDAGLKAFATEAGAPPIVSGAPPGSVYRFTGDEHGAVFVPDGAQAPALGSRVTLIAPHCDPTVNLYNVYHVVRGDTLVAIWPVTARGASA